MRAIRSIAAKIGCSVATLREWLRKTAIDSGRRRRLTSDERAQPPANPGRLLQSRYRFGVVPGSLGELLPEGVRDSLLVH